MTDVEIWTPVVGWETDYEVSSIGRVRTVAARRATRQGVRWRHARVKVQNICPYGYRRVKLTNKVSGKPDTTMTVHRLVAMAFISNPLNLETVNHKDGDKANNTIENLEWATRSDNSKHGHANGLMTPLPRGERHHAAKLTDDIVRTIRTTDFAVQGTQAALARRLNISVDTIRLVRKGLRWAHVS